MKISLDWIKDYIKPGMGAQALADKMTMAGLEVEAIHSINADKVFEVEVTPNRSDCLNMIGVARELSAILNKPKKLPKVKKIKYPRAQCNIKIADKNGCQRYIGTVIENVRVGKTPEEIKKRLASAETRAINNIVDITNFVLMETGQPLHAFDYDKLAGGRIIVRRAKKGEKIITIDEIERKLDEFILVIADETKPVAIAGIMGGKGSEVTEKTKNILLESAYFDPVLTRRASRKLGLSSDSSYRFERGVVLDYVKSGSDRAVSLILDSAGGSVTQYADIKIKTKAARKPPIKISVNKINSRLGAYVSKGRCCSILKNLDFGVKSQGKDSLVISAPPTRPDVTGESDVIEEIARIEGYDKMPISFPTVKIPSIPRDDKRPLRKKLKLSLVAQGFDEAITYSMTNQESLNKTKEGHLFSTKILNPLSQEQEMMRPSMLPNLLYVVSSNINRGQKDLRFFETGKVYIKEDEVETLGLVMAGARSNDWRQTSERDVNFYDIKGALVHAVRQVAGNQDIGFMAVEETAYESGTGALIQLGQQNIGTLGRVDEGILDNFDINEGVFFAQIDLEKVFAKKSPRPVYKTVSSYPAIVRDISLTLDKSTPYKKLIESIESIGSKILVDISFKEDYTNIVRGKIPADHRGILISLVYQSNERTLEEKEVNADHQTILDALVNKLKASIR